MNFLGSQKLQAIRYAATGRWCLCCAACLIMKHFKQQEQHDSGARATVATKNSLCVKPHMADQHKVDMMKGVSVHGR